MSHCSGGKAVCDVNRAKQKSWMRHFERGIVPEVWKAASHHALAWAPKKMILVSPASQPHANCRTCTSAALGSWAAGDIIFVDPTIPHSFIIAGLCCPETFHLRLKINVLVLLGWRTRGLHVSDATDDANMQRLTLRRSEPVSNTRRHFARD